MSADDILMDVEERMEKAAAVLKQALIGVRTGRANPGLVDSVRVTAYGSPTPMKQLASVGVSPEGNQIVIRPFDPGTLKDIEKAILASDLGFTPLNDGRVVRINVPPLSTETRRKLVGRIKELSEEAKVAIRNVRRDANKAADGAFNDREITEDQLDEAKEQVQELTKTYEGKVKERVDKKSVELME